MLHPISTHVIDYFICRHHQVLSCFAEPELGVVLQLKHEVSLWDVDFPVLQYQQDDSGCCKLLSPALICHPSFLDWDRPSAPSALILPVSGNSASLSESGPLVVNACNFPAAEQLTCQTGLPPRHSLRYWWFPLGWREERKSRPVLFGSLLGQACLFKKEKKGKDFIIHFFSQFSLCAFKQWRSNLNAGVSCVCYQVSPGKGTPGESL